MPGELLLDAKLQSEDVMLEELPSEELLPEDVTLEELFFVVVPLQEEELPIDEDTTTEFVREPVEEEDYLEEEDVDLHAVI